MSETDDWREPTRELVDAGFGSAGPAGLPFRPEDVPVDDLADALAAVEDVESVRRLQSIDTRKTAAAHYERRIDEIAGEEE